MRLLQRHVNGKITLSKNFITNVPKYAILSHTWGEEDSEVTLQDFSSNTWAHKPGADKIRFIATQAAVDGLEYFWIDTCCIDKTNSVELQEAINSMFRWYKESVKCYVYLADVFYDFQSARGGTGQLENQVRNSRWFTRGWTLQELIAPASVEFFSKQRYLIGCQRSMRGLIEGITGIPIGQLLDRPITDFSIDTRWSWARGRQTTRPEDQAYCLWGIFDVHMNMIYGEGFDKAIRRLRREIEDARQEASREFSRQSSYPQHRSSWELNDRNSSFYNPSSLQPAFRPTGGNGGPAVFQSTKGATPTDNTPMLTVIPNVQRLPWDSGSKFQASPAPLYQPNPFSTIATLFPTMPSPDSRQHVQPNTFPLMTGGATSNYSTPMTKGWQKGSSSSTAPSYVYCQYCGDGPISGLFDKCPSCGTRLEWN